MPVLSQYSSHILSEGVLQYRPFRPQAFGKQLSRSNGLEAPRQQIITARPKSFVKTDFFIEPVSLAGCDLYLLAVSPILYPGAITKFPMCFFARPSLKRVGRKGLSLGSNFPVTSSLISLRGYIGAI